MALFLSPIDMFSLLKALSRYGGDDRGCYDVGDMWEQKSVLKEGESPGVILPVPGNPFHRLEIHPQAGQPHGFIAGGEGVFVVTEY